MKSMINVCQTPSCSTIFKDRLNHKNCPKHSACIVNASYAPFSGNCDICIAAFNDFVQQDHQSRRLIAGNILNRFENVKIWRWRSNRLSGITWGDFTYTHKMLEVLSVLHKKPEVLFVPSEIPVNNPSPILRKKPGERLGAPDIPRNIQSPILHKKHGERFGAPESPRNIQSPIVRKKPGERSGACEIPRNIQSPNIHKESGERFGAPEIPRNIQSSKSPCEPSKKKIKLSESYEMLERRRKSMGDRIKNEFKHELSNIICDIKQAIVNAGREASNPLLTDQMSPVKVESPDVQLPPLSTIATTPVETPDLDEESHRSDESSVQKDAVLHSWQYLPYKWTICVDQKKNIIGLKRKDGTMLDKSAFHYRMDGADFMWKYALVTYGRIVGLGT